LAFSLYMNNDISQSILLFERGAQELRKLYTINKFWSQELIRFLNPLIYIYNEAGNSARVEELEKELHSIGED